MVFASSRERDIVQSFASSLADFQGEAGLRMELPGHLHGLFKIFEAHRAGLRQQFPGLKRSIKYDDATQSLCMDVRMADRNKWHRISEVEMRETVRRQSLSHSQPAATLETKQDEEDRQKILSMDVQERKEIPVVPGDGEGDDVQ